MSDFNFDLFTKPDQYEETLLRERKALVEYWKPKEKAEFVRDVIALANTARMMGKPAYLILGVKNAAEGMPNDICGIGEMFDRQIGQGRTELQAWETLRGEMADIVHRYITPALSPDIHFDRLGDKVVGYILIQPLTKGPFQVSQEFREGGQTHLRPDKCWLRFGESKQELEREELAPNDDKLRYSYAEVPYVLPSIWQGYFETVQKNIVSKWQKFPPPPREAQQELRNSKGTPIERIVQDFLGQQNDHWLILQGAAGSGKSLFLQNLAKTWAEEGAVDMQAAKQLEQFRPPDGFIPLLFSLRDITQASRTDSGHLRDMLCGELAPLWHNRHAGERPELPQKLFENPRLKWLILLDGLDEVGHREQRRELLNVLKEFMRAYPRLRVILTTRPVLRLEALEYVRLVEIAPLEEAQIEAFFSAQRTEKMDEEIHAFIQRCKGFPDFWNLLGLPVYSNAALSLLGIPTTISDSPEKPPEPVPRPPIPATSSPSGAIPANLDSEAFLEVEKPVTEEMPQRLDEQTAEKIDLGNITLPRLLDRVYLELWDRDEKRKTYEGVKTLRNATYRLAATQMRKLKDMVELEQAKEMLTENGLRWTLEMGVLADNEHDHIFFYIPSAQVYSAAKKLQGDVKGGFWNSIYQYRRRWQQTYRAEIETFFKDLTGNSLQTILITRRLKWLISLLKKFNKSSLILNALI